MAIRNAQSTVFMVKKNLIVIRDINVRDKA